MNKKSHRNQTDLVTSHLCPTQLLVVFFSVRTGNKPTILVVMHHTFDPDYMVTDSRRLTDDPRVKLSVNCLFYEQNLLNSNCNDIAVDEIQRFLKLNEVTTGFTDILLLLFKITMPLDYSCFSLVFFLVGPRVHLQS